MVEQNQVWVGSEDSIIYIINIHSMSCNKQLTDHRASVTGLVVQDGPVAPRYAGSWEARGSWREGVRITADDRPWGQACRGKRVQKQVRWPACLFLSWGQRSTVCGRWHLAFLGFGWPGRSPGRAAASRVLSPQGALPVSLSVQISPSYEDARRIGWGLLC